MAVVYCTRHKIGYNTDLEAVCPQCTLSRQDAAPVEDEATHFRFQKEVELARLKAELGVV